MFNVYMLITKKFLAQIISNYNGKCQPHNIKQSKDTSNYNVKCQLCPTLRNVSTVQPLMESLWVRTNATPPKKSSLLSPPLCSSNVRVCFHMMRSVSTVRNTFLKYSLSILFRLLHFPVSRFPPLQSGAAFSSPAFSAPPMWRHTFNHLT